MTRTGARELTPATAETDRSAPQKGDIGAQPLMSKGWQNLTLYRPRSIDDPSSIEHL
jgi:hypothetical protein